MSEKLFDEELLFFKSSMSSKMFCIEETALSFEWVKEGMSSLFKDLRKDHEIEYLQSYGAIAALILNEVGGGIVPLGIAERFKIPSKLRIKNTKKIYRPIHLYSKKTFFTSLAGNKIFEVCSKISKEGSSYLEDFK